jgi:hypothetical protein
VSREREEQLCLLDATNWGIRLKRILFLMILDNGKSKSKKTSSVDLCAVSSHGGRQKGKRAKEAKLALRQAHSLNNQPAPMA